ncbi:MAG: hypothetical protein K0U93_24525 [Gammaproteobacteria bacterium]|nr:hypothetical protein [Gammaproteobacteria bacterium]
MQSRSYLSLALALVVSVASSKISGADWPPAQVAPNSAISKFMRALAVEKYSLALSLLHPDLVAAWAPDEFASDWEEIRASSDTPWKPRATGLFFGKTPRGDYQHATYDLHSDVRTGLELVSMNAEGQERIVRLVARIPHEGGSPIRTQVLSERFIESLVSGNVESAREMLAPERRSHVPVTVLHQMSSFAQAVSTDSETTYYRVWANAVWYDASRTVPRRAPATFLELIFQTGREKSWVTSWSAKARP